jgi:MinD superfamily P-loop ATPase
LKEITILSGKGGTGKTTITASFAVLAQNTVTADCDVDAPDLHILLHPKPFETQDFFGPKIAKIDKKLCVNCGLCQDSCKYGAIKDFQINPIHCEGCGVCEVVCPEKAISLQDRVSGQAFLSKNKYGFMSHALLNPGGANSGKLVTLVRNNAKKIATNYKSDLIIVDGSPGIGCPVIASIAGVNFAVLVAEPTLSGIHDLKRVLQLLSHFKVPALVCINKYDLNPDNTRKIEDFCSKNNIELIGKISFNTLVTKAMVAGTPVVEYAPKSMISNSIKQIWKQVQEKLKTIH